MRLSSRIWPIGASVPIVRPVVKPELFSRVRSSPSPQPSPPGRGRSSRAPRLISTSGDSSQRSRTDFPAHEPVDLWRRLAICRVAGWQPADRHDPFPHAPIANRRNSRLPVGATRQPRFIGAMRARSSGRSLLGERVGPSPRKGGFVPAGRVREKSVVPQSDSEIRLTGPKVSLPDYD